jgi:DSF synthase
MKGRPRPCFTPQLLQEIRLFIDNIVDEETCGNGHLRTRYAVLASNIEGVFNLGGDLELFRNAIMNRDEHSLRYYAQLCVDDLFWWHRNFDLPVTTISLVQGEAMGGGLEAALASTVIIAEESSRMGFPEVLFNLFPGMGAYSFLRRKVGRATADELITSGNIYTAGQLHDLGVVDVLTPDGTGEAAVYGYIRKHARSANGRRAYEQVRRDLDAITREEFETTTDIWVDAALRLTERDLRMMDRLVRAQRRFGAGEIERRMDRIGGGLLETVE